MIKKEDCEITREPGWNRIRHLPSDRCVACQDDDVTDDELFTAIIRDSEHLNDFPEDSKKVFRTFQTDEVQ